jgi:prepilin-type N-terminal cleavage/methylation domain-containing protein/prepilin-type processing-associated H-X9-DG protein
MIQQKRKAFTLIELLVVISIIALLLSILMPALSRAKEHAKRIVCASSLKQVHLAMTMYVGENRELMPENPWGGEYNMYIPNINSATGKPIGWTGLGKLYSNDYMENPEVFYCPSEKIIKYNVDNLKDPLNLPDDTRSVFPSSGDPDYRILSSYQYRYSYWSHGPMDDGEVPPDSRAGEYKNTQDKIKFSAFSRAGIAGDRTGLNLTLLPLHFDARNYVFGDGHVDSIKDIPKTPINFEGYLWRLHIDTAKVRQ